MAQNNYPFPDNKEKHFVNADEFFQRGNLYGYTEYQEANINFQQSLLYKDLRKFIKSNVNEYYYRNLVNVYSDPHRGVSPNRQVYFYCSILDNDKTLKYKFSILDAETTERIVEGSGQGFKETE